MSLDTDVCKCRESRRYGESERGAGGVTIGLIDVKCRARPLFSEEIKLG